jgi:hypothetical protein
MLRRVALVRIDVSEELSASIIGVTRLGELGTLAVTSNRRTLRVFLRSVRRLLVTANVPSSPSLVAPMTEALSSSETSIITRATWRNIPEDTILHSHHRWDLKSYIHFEATCTGKVWLSCEAWGSDSWQLLACTTSRLRSCKLVKGNILLYFQNSEDYEQCHQLKVLIVCFLRPRQGHSAISHADELHSKQNIFRIVLKPVIMQTWCKLPSVRTPEAWWCLLASLLSLNGVHTFPAWNAKLRPAVVP